MEQRPLRLGDIVDDYCPRERRVTNHAIVALVGEASVRPDVPPAIPNMNTKGPECRRKRVKPAR